MAITPKLSMYINILIALMSAIVTGAIKFTGIVSDPISHDIIQWCGFLLSIIAVVNAAMHSISSQGEGPLANMKLQLVKIPPKVVILFALLMPYLAAGIMTRNSLAAMHHEPPVVLNNDIKDVPLNFEGIEPQETVQLIPPPRPSGESLSLPANLPDIFKSVLAGVEKITIQDLQGASIIASNSGDVLASQCYQAVIGFIQKTNSLNVDPSTGKPVELGNIHLISDFQMAKVITGELLPTSQTSVQCAPFANANGIVGLANLLKNLAAGAIQIK